MNFITGWSAIAFVLALCAHPKPISAQQTSLPRELSKPNAISSEAFGILLNVVELSDGKLLVDDGERRRVVLLDNKLGKATTVLDSSAGGRQSYGPTAAPLIAYLGDSALFVDVQTSTFVLLDPRGNVVRTVAPARSGDDMLFISRYGAFVNPLGQMLYRSRYRSFEAGSPTGDTSAPTITPIVLANLDTRTVDTIATYALAPQPVITRDTTRSKILETWKRNALPTVDEWTMLSGGDIAIVRGHDYHVDVRSRDGTVYHGAKLPFAFRKLTDAEKIAIIDSARAAVKQQVTPTAVSRPPSTFGSDMPGPNRAVIQRELVIEFLPPDKMPDYYPPVRAGAMMADKSDQAWILPTTSAQSRHGELVYDVVNNRGEFQFHVRLPEGRMIVGFGQRDVVYLGTKTLAGWIIERTHVEK